MQQLAAGAKHWERTRDSLANSTNATRLGSRLLHTYRANNKQGISTLDSSEFIVFNQGTVTPLRKIEDVDLTSISIR